MRTTANMQFEKKIHSKGKVLNFKSLHDNYDSNKSKENKLKKININRQENISRFNSFIES